MNHLAIWFGVRLAVQNDICRRVGLYVVCVWVGCFIHCVIHRFCFHFISVRAFIFGMKTDHGAIMHVRCLFLWFYKYIQISIYMTLIHTYTKGTKTEVVDQPTRKKDIINITQTVIFIKWQSNKNTKNWKHNKQNPSTSTTHTHTFFRLNGYQYWCWRYDIEHRSTTHTKKYTQKSIKQKNGDKFCLNKLNIHSHSLRRSEFTWQLLCVHWLWFDLRVWGSIQSIVLKQLSHTCVFYGAFDWEYSEAIVWMGDWQQQLRCVRKKQEKHLYKTNLLNPRHRTTKCLEKTGWPVCIQYDRVKKEH